MNKIFSETYSTVCWSGIGRVKTDVIRIIHVILYNILIGVCFQGRRATARRTWPEMRNGLEPWICPSRAMTSLICPWTSLTKGSPSMTWRRRNSLSLEILEEEEKIRFVWGWLFSPGCGQGILDNALLRSAPRRAKDLEPWLRSQVRV